MDRKKIECFTIDGRYFFELKGEMYDKPTPTTVSVELWQDPGNDPVLRADSYILINKAYSRGCWFHNVRAHVDRVETRMVSGHERICTMMTLYRPNHKFE